MGLNVDKAADSEKSAEAGAPEVEITREMIAAGVAEIVTFNLDYEDREDVVRRIFKAMLVERCG